MSQIVKFDGGLHGLKPLATSRTKPPPSDSRTRNEMRLEKAWYISFPGFWRPLVAAHPSDHDDERSTSHFVGMSHCAYACQVTMRVPKPYWPRGREDFPPSKQDCLEIVWKYPLVGASTINYYQ